MPDPGSPSAVSPADTIRQALAHLDSYCEPCLFSENAHAALDALLAVGERDKADAQLALDALPDPMHPALRQWADAMTDAKILLAHVAGHDDPGDVEANRAVLADKEDADGD